jgi:hypothetical protein
MRRFSPSAALTASVIAFYATAGLGQTGHVVCTQQIDDTTGVGYHHEETQRWDIVGPALACPGITNGTKDCYPFAWSDQGSGHSGVNQWYISAAKSPDGTTHTMFQLKPGSSGTSLWAADIYFDVPGGLYVNGHGSGQAEWSIFYSQSAMEPPVDLGSGMSAGDVLTEYVGTPPFKAGNFPTTCTYAFALMPALQYPVAVARGAGAFDAFALDPANPTLIRRKSYSGSWGPFSATSTWGITGTGPAAGFVRSAPAAVSLSATELHAFAIGADGVAYHNVFAGPCVPGCAASSSWESIGTAGATTSLLGSVATVSINANQFDLFATGTDGKVYHKSYSNGTWMPGKTASWEPIGGRSGVTLGTPAAVSWGPARFDVFAAGNDGKVYHKFYQSAWFGSGPGSQLGDWESIGGLPGWKSLVAGSLSAVSWGYARFDVFANGVDGRVYHKFFDYAWGPNSINADWESVSGPPATTVVNGKQRPTELVGSSAAVSGCIGCLDIFVTATDGQIYHQYYAGVWGLGGMTANWEPLGGPGLTYGFYDTPAAVASGNGQIDVIAIGANANAYDKSYNAHVEANTQTSNWLMIGY